jgi:hypothetical protein
LLILSPVGESDALCDSYQVEMVTAGVESNGRSPGRLPVLVLEESESKLAHNDKSLETRFRYVEMSEWLLSIIIISGQMHSLIKYFALIGSVEYTHQ